MQTIIPTPLWGVDPPDWC